MERKSRELISRKEVNGGLHHATSSSCLRCCCLASLAAPVHVLNHESRSDSALFSTSLRISGYGEREFKFVKGRSALYPTDRLGQHGMPRVAAASQDRSEQARERETKQIQQYQQLEADVLAKVS